MTHFTRAEWGAREPRPGGNEVTNGPEGVDVHYNGPAMGIKPGVPCSCAQRVRSIQDDHMDLRGWKDIAYDVVACPHGNTFQGRIGTINGTGANGSDEGNLGWMAVMALVGGTEPWGYNLKLAVLAGIALCREAGAGPKIGPHSQHEDTECPGIIGHAWIAKGCPAPLPFERGLEATTTTTTTRPATTTTTTTAVVSTTTTTRPATTTTTTTAPQYVPANEIGMLLKVTQPRMKGTAVSAAQRRLTLHGQAVSNDSIYGPGTEAAIKAFQTSKGLTADGVAGEKTWAALLAPTGAEMRKETLEILKARAWVGAPNDTQIIKDFQAAWNFGPALTVDGIAGARTHAAALVFKSNGEKLSPNFTAAELKCRCEDRYPECRRIFTKRSLLAALEKLRAAHYKTGLRVVSGSRCDRHNASIRGAYARSQHRYGRACDIEPRLTVAQARALGVFSGIGYARTSKLVVHVDVRADAGPDRDNYPAGSNANPNVFPEG